MDYGNLKNRDNKRRLKAEPWFCLFLIFILLFANGYSVALFNLTALAQTDSNPVELVEIEEYVNINYYPEDTTPGSQKSAHLLNIYRAKNCKSCPVMVYIHGGYWVMGDKNGFSDKAKAFTANGFVYVSINYRLAPDYQFPENVEDTARAFAWVKENIIDYGGDPEQIYLLGHSAGGHLAAMIALDERYLAPFHLIPSDIAGIISLDSSAYYLPALFAAEPESQFMISWAFGEEEGDLEIGSPINYVREGLTIPPILLLVAGGRNVSEQVNNSFYQKLIENGYQADIFQFPEKEHVSLDYDLGSAGDKTFPFIMNWLYNKIIRS